MRTLFLVCILMIGMQFHSFGQEIFIKTGINSTTYDFRSADGAKLLNFTPGMGNSIEMGMGFPFVPKIAKEGEPVKERSYAPNWLKNEVSLNLDSFNSFSGNQNNNYSWETTYGGLTNTLSFLGHIGEVELGIRGALGLSGMISGTQVINSSRFPLKGEADFKGLFAKTGMGISASYPVFQRAFLNLTYNYSKSSRLGGPEEEQVRFLSHGVLFGLYIQLK
ncbi:MAG: hypothetical protein FJX97_00850 [Bacteroidetes bacterium]|nr:hypothetical protein [Bacteroidota bacterium]